MIKIHIAVQARTGWGWPYLVARKTEEQGFILKWIRDVIANGSEDIQALADNLDEMLDCQAIVRVTSDILDDDALEGLNPRFAGYYPTRNIALFGLVIERYRLQILIGQDQEDTLCFLVADTTTNQAFILFPDNETRSWWPEASRAEDGNPLSTEICDKLIAIAFPPTD